MTDDSTPGWTAAAAWGISESIVGGDERCGVVYTDETVCAITALTRGY